MDAEQVRRELWKGLNEINLSKALAVFCATRGDLTSFVTTVAEAIADESKPEPPEPPKTVLPDMSGAEIGKHHWFFAGDGTQVEYFSVGNADDKPWRLALFGQPYCGVGEFVLQHPHLGRLRRAVPGEVAE